MLHEEYPIEMLQDCQFTIYLILIQISLELFKITSNDTIIRIIQATPHHAFLKTQIIPKNQISAPKPIKNLQWRILTAFKETGIIFEISPKSLHLNYPNHFKKDSIVKQAK